MGNLRRCFRHSASVTFLVMGALVSLVGCKPTEANYREAYDAAQVKRAEAAAEQMRPATGLLSDDGPQLRVVEGDTVFVLRERVRELDGAIIPAKWLVAVGCFKIDTNAKASASDIRERGFANAFAAKAPGGKYYAISDTAMNLESARTKAQAFRAAFPGYPYVSLPGAPVLISN